MLQLPKESRLARPQRVDHRVWTLFLDDQGPAQMAQYISDMGAMISENQLRTAEHLPILTWYTFKKGIGLFANFSEHGVGVGLLNPKSLRLVEMSVSQVLDSHKLQVIWISD